MPYTFTGNRIQETYGRILQMTGSTVYNGLGEVITFLPTVTCSYALTASHSNRSETASICTSASYAETASYAIYQISNEISSSWSSQSFSSSHALMADNAGASVTSSYSLATNVTMSHPIFIDGGIRLGATGSGILPAIDVDADLGSSDLRWRNVFGASLVGTSSWASNALTTSYASTATSASYAETSSYAIYQISNEVSASWASMSFSSSHTEISDTSDTVRGLTIEFVANDTSGTGSNYRAATLADSTAVSSSSPHCCIKVGNVFYLGGWDGRITRVNDVDNNLSDVTLTDISTSYYTPTGPRAISDGVYNTVTGQIYFIITATYPSSADWTGIVKMDPTTLSHSLMLDGLGGFSADALPPLVTYGQYLYTVTTNGTIYKIDAVSQSVVASTTLQSASVTITYTHAAQMDPSGLFFLTSTSNSTGHIAKISTSDITNFTASRMYNNGTTMGGITDDFALIGDYFYPIFESGYLGFLKINKNTLSQSHHNIYMQGYGSWNFNNNLYVNVKGGPPTAPEMWVYPDADLYLGPVRFTTTGNANEAGFTNGGKILGTNWGSTGLYTYYMPYLEVGVGMSPMRTLDVAGTIRAPYGEFTSQVTTNILRFSGSIANTGSSVSISQNGRMTVARITGSSPIGESGLKMSYITCSFLTASAGMRGTASWAEYAISASWAPTTVTTVDSASWASSSLSASWAPYVDTGTTLYTASTYQITSSWAVSSSWAPTATPGTTLYTASTYQITSSWAVSASWAPTATPGTTLYTASTYQITSSWAVSSSWAGFAKSSSYGDFAKSASWADRAGSGSWSERAFTSSYAYSSSWSGQTVSSSWADRAGSGSYAYSSSWSGQTVSSSWAARAGSGSWAENAKSSSWGERSFSASWADNAKSSSWGERSLTASFALNGGTGGTTLFTASTYDITASWANSSSYAGRAFTSSYAYSSSWAGQVVSASWADRAGSGSWSENAKSSSWGERSLTSSYAHSAQIVSASWADRSGTSSYAHSTLTASYALANPSTSFPASVTQSSWDVTMRDMSAPSSGAWQGGVITAPLVGDHIGSIQPDLPVPLHNLTFWYLRFVDHSGAAGSTTASLAMYQNRVPQSYVGGLTHSFQFYPVGISGQPPTNANVFWEIDLYSLTSSLSVVANLYSAPVLVETKRITSSLNGFVHDSGSIITTSSYFNDPSNYLQGGSIMFFTIRRITPWNVDGGAYDSGSNHYTGSVDMITSRFSWNAA